MTKAKKIMIKLAVSGCLGRMGQRITALGSADKDFKITCLLESPDHPQSDQTISGIKIATTPDALKGSAVLIEFTSPEATMLNLEGCLKHKVKMVIGTTGINSEQRARIEAASKQIPIVFSSNMSIGVNIVFKLAEMLAKAAPPNYEVRMVEAHHIHKKDAPSGTAKTMAEIIEKSSAHKVTDIQAIREGEIIGDHKIIFESGEDVITLDHHAKNRDIFVKGALVAAKFVAGKSSGLFNMKDVLKIN
jgi:4-hydroxy-tetrahydrodipicolinate reductase